MTFTAAVFRYGAVLIVLVALPELVRFAPGRVAALGWASLAGVILLCTVIPYLLNAWALARTHASHVAFYVFLQPFVATVLAILILGEELTAKDGAGGAPDLRGARRRGRGRPVVPAPLP